MIKNSKKKYHTKHQKYKVTMSSKWHPNLELQVHDTTNPCKARIAHKSPAFWVTHGTQHICVPQLKPTIVLMRLC